MAWGWLVGALAAALLPACHRRPEPVYEYGETVTLTSTEKKDGAPAPAPVPAPSGAAAPVGEEPPAEEAVRASEVDGHAADTAPHDTATEGEAPLAEDEWSVSVDAGAPPSRREPSAPEPEAAGDAGAAPASVTDAPAPKREWYKAKTW